MRTAQLTQNSLTTHHPVPHSVANSSAINHSASPLALANALTQGVLGWEHVAEKMQQASAEDQEFFDALKQAENDYKNYPNEYTEQKYLAQLDAGLKRAQEKRDYFQGQKKQYQEEYDREVADREHSKNSFFLKRWGAEALSGIKHFFGSTPEQLVEKYHNEIKKKDDLIGWYEALMQQTANSKQQTANSKNL